MGRSCREKKRVIGVSEEKEQKKIRDSILKVFQARVSSPGQGGALLVAEPRQTDKQKHSKKRKSTKCVLSESTSTDDSPSDSMSGRGKKRTKSESLSRRKSRKTTTNQREAEKDTAVSKHLRVAHGITGQQTCVKTDGRSKPKMYSHSRITQKVGLISTGTKGAPASRGLAVPEHISKQTEEEIRKMSEEAEADVHMTGDILVAEKLVLSRVGNQVSSTDRKLPTPVSIDTRPPQISACNSVESIRARQSPYGADTGKFPHRLPVKETVASLMTSLKYLTKTLYPERDYLKETHGELLKLVRQNAPRSATPTRLPVFNTISKSGSVRRPLVDSFTSEESDHHSYNDNKLKVEKLLKVDYKGEHQQNVPIEHAYSFNDEISLVPKINFADYNPFAQATNTERGQSHFEKRYLPSRGLSSIKRSREQLYKDTDDNNNVVRVEKENGTEQESLHHLYNNSRLLEHRRKKVQKEIREYIDTHKPDHNQEIRTGKSGIKDQFSDLSNFFARRKVEQEDYFFSGTGTHVSKMPKSPVLKSQAKLTMPRSPVLSWEAKSLLQANEESNCNIEIFEPMEVDMKGAEAVNLLQQNDILKDRSQQQVYVQPDRMERGYDRTLDWVNRESRSNSQCSHCSQGSGDLLSQVQIPTRQSNYMPSFHGNYYTDHMATGDLSWQQKSHRVKVEAMDILDYVDQYIGRDSYMDCRGDRTTTVSAASPDQSPLWQVPDKILSRKNLLPRSPKSPDGPKFYPKKMY